MIDHMNKDLRIQSNTVHALKFAKPRRACRSLLFHASNAAICVLRQQVPSQLGMAPKGSQLTRVLLRKEEHGSTACLNL